MSDCAYASQLTGPLVNVVTFTWKDDHPCTPSSWTEAPLSQAACLDGSSGRVPSIVTCTQCTPPPRSLGVYALPPLTHNGEEIEVDGQGYVVTALVVQCKLFKVGGCGVECILSGCFKFDETLDIKLTAMPTHCSVCGLKTNSSDRNLDWRAIAMQQPWHPSHCYSRMRADTGHYPCATSMLHICAHSIPSALLSLCRASTCASTRGRRRKRLMGGVLTSKDGQHGWNTVA